MEKLSAYRKSVESSGGSTTNADLLIDAITVAEDLSQLPQLFARLADESDRIGWFRDCDYAAVALQAASSNVGARSLRNSMLIFALDRALWCASCATAGGEGLARSLHVRELETLINNAT